MSHEMRTPLNGVLGMLQLAMELEMLPRAQQFCAVRVVGYSYYGYTYYGRAP